MKVKRTVWRSLALLLTICLMMAAGGIRCQVLASATETEETNVQQETKATEEKTYPYEADLKFAKNFKITYLEEGIKILTDASDNEVLLLAEGKEAPDAYKDLPVIKTPITKAIFMSTTQVGFLRAFDDDTLYESIVGVRMPADQWDIPAVKKQMEEGKTIDIGSNTATENTYDYELMLSLEPNLVFLIGGSMNQDSEKMIEMLDQENIVYVQDGSAGEDDYRGTMEWIKFVAALYDLDDEAEEFFDQGMKRIEDVQEKVKDADKPLVGWAIVAMGTVYVEDAGSKTAKMVRAAGADYLFDGIGDDSNSVTSIDFEAFYDYLEKADLLIYRGMPRYSPDLKSVIEQAPVLDELEIFHDGRIWQITDTFWNTYHSIDDKYVELAAIFHPDLFPDVEIKNFRIMPFEAEISENSKP